MIETEELLELKETFEASKAELKQSFKEQLDAINKTGKIDHEAQKLINHLQEKSKTAEDELKKLKNRLLDIEQKGVMAPELSQPDNWVQKAVKGLMDGWKENRSTFELKSSLMQKAVTSANDSAGALIQPHRVPGIIIPGIQRLLIRSLLAPGTISTNSIEYVKEKLFDNQAAPVGETKKKPESKITFEKADAPVRTLAHWIRVSRQVMDDAPMLQSYIMARMLYGLAFKEEEQMLNGDGTGDNLMGINTVATEYKKDFDETGDNLADITAHAMLQVNLSQFPASGIILNPIDWHKMTLLKDKNGNYLFGGPQTFASRILWGLPVIDTDSQAKGTFTVGAFSLASQIFDRMLSEFKIAEQNEDDFTKNMLTIRSESRLALVHYRPQAIIKGKFPTAEAPKK